MTDETRKLLLRAEAIPRGDEDDLVHCLAAALRESDRERDEAKQAKVAAGIKADEALRRCVADLDEARNHAARLRSALEAADCICDERRTCSRCAALAATPAGSLAYLRALERACESGREMAECDSRGGCWPKDGAHGCRQKLLAALAEVEKAKEGR